jgi:hypothetical protein
MKLILKPYKDRGYPDTGRDYRFTVKNPIIKDFEKISKIIRKCIRKSKKISKSYY